MILKINNNEYTATEYSAEDAVILVEKSLSVIVQAYEDFRAVTSFELGGTTYTNREFTGAYLLESGGNIQATYSTVDTSGVDPVMRDKAEAYDILMGGEA